MLKQIAEQLDGWVIDRNVEAQHDGFRSIPPFTIRLLGQSALLEHGLALTLAATKDVDVRADYPDAVRREFERLLRVAGLTLDPVGHEAWMPKETRYTELFRGRFVRLLLAEPEAILLSKALKAPVRNGPLVAEYLATGATDRFLELAQKYELDLEQFV